LSENDFPFCPCEGGLRIFIRLTPKGKKNALNAVMEGVDGQKAFKISITAVPEKGKANAQLIKFLAKEWHVAKSDIEIIAGEIDRHKTLLLKGETTALHQRLIEWMKQNNVSS
jgi:uncharacterized protein